MRTIKITEVPLKTFNIVVRALTKSVYPIILCATLSMSPLSAYSKEIALEAVKQDVLNNKVIKKTDSAVEYRLIWENEKIKEEHPLIVELINSPAFQRLKGVDQSGPITYFGEMYYFTKHGYDGWHMPEFSRYDHSLAVMTLVKQALGIKDLKNASIEELKPVVAALLHDASHTAFSHLGDHFLAALGKNKDTQNCYQDDVHLSYLAHFKVDKILQKYGISLEQINPELYKVLKAPKGSLSADKIQYITHTAVILKIFDSNVAKAIINDLIYDKATGEWYFKTPELAKQFGEASIILTRHVYTAPDNYAFYQYFTKALLEGVKSNLFTVDIFKYGTDEQILQKLKKSSNPLIKHYLKRLDDIKQAFEVVKSNDDADIKVDKLTFRGVDPKVKLDNGSIVELSKIDNVFAGHISELKTWCKDGYGIKFNNDEMQIIHKLEQNSLNNKTTKKDLKKAA